MENCAIKERKLLKRKEWDFTQGQFARRAKEDVDSIIKLGSHGLHGGNDVGAIRVNEGEVDGLIDEELEFLDLLKAELNGGACPPDGGHIPGVKGEENRNVDFSPAPKFPVIVSP